jgi:hyperosmotically inducible protein
MSNRTYLLSGLTALLLAVSACATNDQAASRTAGQTVDDSVLATRAKTALVQNDATKARNIDVTVYKGDVQLNGFVDSASEKQSAEATVKGIAGVKTVHNNLQVQPTDRTAGRVVDDAVITTKVKAALIADERTKAYQIQVTTKQGKVQLGGFVDSNDAKNAAAEVAMSIAGVKSVNNALEVKG